MLEVRLLGTFAIACDGKPVALSSRAAQSLFAYLILTAGAVHRREKLAGMFWPDANEEKARAYLRNELWRIRKALPTGEFLVSNDIGIAFDASASYWLDAMMLKKLTHTDSADELMAALSVLHGELLPGFYENWVVLEREHMQSVYEQVMARLLKLLESEKRWFEILEWAERWISFGQGPEAAYRALMSAYEALGDLAKVASTYQRCVQALRELDLEPSEQTRAVAFKRTHLLNIPIPLTSFIGREKELEEVATLLSKFRLVTLTGSGGVGKTRLSIQVVADVLYLFPDGVWFLDLAPLTDPALVPNALVNLLGLSKLGDANLTLTDLLIKFFRSRTALVIFDNCEHLIESCAQLVHSLLTSCEHLSILATSREALRVSGEIPYRVPSLETPKSGIEPTIHALTKIESVRLFVERAMVVSPAFTIDTQNAQTIAQICQRLDGIPLAIELAAARINVLAIEHILKRLDERFGLLTGGLRSALPRHQTLFATIDWSYSLLSEPERILFRRLAVFMGGWTLEAAEEVCSGNGIESRDVLELLSLLVNKSLVVVEGPNDSETRYRRLETIRQFAREKLFETVEAARLEDMHLTYFVKKAEEIEPELIGVDQPALLDYLDREFDNIRLALEYSISNKRGEEALRLFGALGWFWVIRCHFLEGIQWFRRAFALREKASISVQIKALRHVGSLYFNQEDFSASRDVLRESLHLCRVLGDTKEISTGLQFLGVLETGQGDFDQARLLLEESLTISRKVHNKPAITRALLNLANISQMEGDYFAALQQYEEGLTICRETQDSHLTALLLGSMGDLMLAQKNISRAHEYYEEALVLCLKVKNKRKIAETLLAFVNLMCAEAQYAQSAQLQGFAVAMLNEPGVILTKTALVEIEKAANILKTYIGEHAYRKNFDIGKTFQLEQAVRIALQQEE